MRTCVVSPERQGFSNAFGSGVVSSLQDGAASRYRPGLLGEPDVVTAVWLASPNEFRYLRALYRTGLREGMDAFLIQVPTGDGLGVVPVAARITPGTFQLSSVQGESHVVQAQLELVRTRPRST